MLSRKTKTKIFLSKKTKTNKQTNICNNFADWFELQIILKKREKEKKLVKQIRMFLKKEREEKEREKGNWQYKNKKRKGVHKMLSIINYHKQQQKLKKQDKKTKKEKKENL